VQPPVAVCYPAGSAWPGPETKESGPMSDFWDQYRYTEPLAAELSAAFGVEFALQHTGGGCVSVQADFDEDTQVLVGSAADGPLLGQGERSGLPFQGGFRVGVSEAKSGFALSDAVDHTAVSPDDVIVLLKTALELVARHTDDTRVVWTRDIDGVVSEQIWPR